MCFREFSARANRAQAEERGKAATEEVVTRSRELQPRLPGGRLPFNSKTSPWIKRGADIFIFVFLLHFPLSPPPHSQKNRGEISNMGQNLNSTNTQRVIAECAVRSLSRFSLSLKLIYNNMRLYTRFADRKPINRLFSR